MALLKGARALFCVLAATAAAGCAQPPGQIFDLSGARVPTRAAAPVGAVLSVREPSAVPPTSSNRIVVREADGAVAVLPDVGWSEPLPRLLRSRIIESLQKAGVPAARVGGGGRALATDIRRFEIDIARNVAVVEIAARIVDENSAAARAAQSFTAETPAPEHTGAPAARALTEAAGQALARIGAWARGRL